MWMFLTLAFGYAVAAVAAEAAAGESSSSLYSSAGIPVIEFTSTRDGRVQPDFLSAGAQHSFRLVQFYDIKDEKSVAMREEFLRTARNLNEVAAKSPSKTITIYAVSCTEYPITCQKQGITSYPTFRFYEPGSRQAEVIDTLDTQELIQKMDLKKEPADGKWFSIKPTQTTAPLRSQSTEEAIHVRTLAQLQSDIHLSFDTAMRHYIYHHVLEDSQPLSKFQRVVLKNWLILVHKTLPPSWTLHAIVKELLNSFMYVAKNRIYLLSILDSHKPENTEYSQACQGPLHNPVTCGVWEMFHAVSVGVVEYNKSGMARSERMSVSSALQVMGEYIDMFGFGGDDMTKILFEQQWQNCLGDMACLKDVQVDETDKDGLVSSWIELPLWLSKAHTAVNHNIKADKERRSFQNIAIPTVADANWPPIKLCPTCWVEKDGALQWNEKVVYEYLKHEYTKVEKISAEEKMEMAKERIVFSQPPKQNAKKEKESSSRYFTVGYMGLAAFGIRLFLSSRKTKYKSETLPLSHASSSPSSMFPGSPPVSSSRRASFAGPARSPSFSALSHSLLSSSYHSPDKVKRAPSFFSPSGRERNSPKTMSPRRTFSTSVMDTPSRKSISRRLVGRRQSFSTTLPMYNSAH